MKKNKERKTWTYLFTATGSVFLLAITAFTAVSIFALRHTAYRQTEENLKQFSRAISYYLKSSPIPQSDEDLQDFSMRFAIEPDFRITIIKQDGSVIADSNANPRNLDNHAQRPEVKQALNGKESANIRWSDTLQKRLVYYAIPHQGFVIRVAVAVDYIDTASRQIFYIIVLAALIILVVTLSVSSLVTARIIAPLHALEQAAIAYDGTNMHFDFPEGRYPKEISELTRTFSQLAITLQEKIKALDTQNRETNAILEGMNDALIILDSNQEIIRVNKAAEDLFHFTEKDAKEMSLIQAVRNTDIVDFVIHHNEGETERTIEIRNGAKQGSSFLLVKASNLNSKGGLLLVFNDITRLKQLERVRKDFVANVSHELKTPVTSIQGFIETLRDGALDDTDTARRFLSIMEQQSLRLGAIIDDLLSISRLEQHDEGELSKKEASIDVLMNDVKNICEEEAKRKKTELIFTCEPMKDCLINAGLIEQAITNLVLNAIKYSPEKSTVQISAKSLSSLGIRRLIFTVTDNGIGIPSKHLSRIFERFYRIDKGRSRDQGGTGLGLSIVRHIALAHMGSVSVSSIEGKGSTFTFDIPV